MTNTTPILAIDIDGPLALRVFTKADRQRAKARGFRQVSWHGKVRRVPGSTWVPYSELWLNPVHGSMLAKFSREHDVELVWASLWEFNANAVVAPVLGLPRLPWVDFHGHVDGPGFWKFRAMTDFAQGRPLAWLDDSFTRKAHQRELSGFDLSRRNLPTLLQEVDETIGVTQQDLDVVASWLKTMRLAWGISQDEPKSPVCQLRNSRRSIPSRSVFADIEHSSMSDQEFIAALALDGSPPF
jgi:hypothetical protein